MSNAFSGDSRRIGSSHQNSHITLDYIGENLGQLIVLSSRKTKFDSDGLPFDKSGLGETLTERLDERRCLVT